MTILCPLYETILLPILPPMLFKGGWEGESKVISSPLQLWKFQNDIECPLLTCWFWWLGEILMIFLTFHTSIWFYQRRLNRKLEHNFFNSNWVCIVFSSNSSDLWTIKLHWTVLVLRSWSRASRSDQIICLKNHCKCVSAYEHFKIQSDIC